MAATRSTSGRGNKHTVYLSADDEKRLADSGLTIGDVIKRGLLVVPPSPDSKLPAELSGAMQFLERMAGIMLHGGTIFTPFAAEEHLKATAEGHPEKLSEDVETLNAEVSGPVDEFLATPSTGTGRKRPPRTRKTPVVPNPNFQPEVKS